MQNKHSLKLRKEIMFSIPIAICLALVIGLLLINTRKANLDVSKSVEVKSNNKLDNKLAEDNEESVSTSGTLLSDNQYIKAYNKYKEQRLIDNTVAYYADVFHLDVNKVVSLARQFTNNYEREDYKTTFSIKEGDGTFSSQEAGIVYFVRYLYRNPRAYGTTAAEIGDKGIITTADKKENGHIVLDNGLTFEQYFSRICEMFGVNKVLALAIVYHESGVMTSGLFRYSNNMGGLRANVEYFKFPSLEAGTICYVFTLKGILDRNGLDSFQSSSVSAISGIYVHGTASQPAPDWVSKVLYYMGRIESNNVFA